MCLCGKKKFAESPLCYAIKDFIRINIQITIYQVFSKLFFKKNTTYLKLQMIFLYLQKIFQKNGLTNGKITINKIQK